MFGKNLLRESCFILFLICILLYGLIFNGCESSTQSVFDETGVKGKVYGLLGFPYQGLKVTAGDTSINTDNYGRFNIPGVTHPYNLVVIDTLSKYCLFIPKHDNTTTNSLALSYLASYQNSSYADIIINYPDSLNGYSKKCFFTDFVEKTLYNYPGDNTGEIFIDMGPGTQYNGSLLVLAYTVSNGHAVRYDKYCIKNNLTVSPGSNLVINPTSADFKNITQQNTYHVTITPPAGTNSNYIFSSFSLSGRRVMNYSLYMQLDTFGNPSADIVVPVVPGMNLYPLICYNSSGFNGNSNSTGYFSGNASFTVPEYPLLVSPGDNEIVDINTELVFNQGLTHVENKYYKLSVYDLSGGNGPHRTFIVYLDRERFKISELNDIGLGSMYGGSFSWGIEVISGISLNEGISDGISNLTRLMSSSLNRKFIVQQR